MSRLRWALGEDRAPIPAPAVTLEALRDAGALGAVMHAEVPDADHLLVNGRPPAGYRLLASRTAGPAIRFFFVVPTHEKPPDLLVACLDSLLASFIRTSRFTSPTMPRGTRPCWRRSAPTPRAIRACATWYVVRGT
ncbi:hypothetical protein [Sphingomonas sp.]|uniref:hypothetical protein n=1 Tax=Sphingomonas sp. TaxID=28214 RepID=UPI003B00C8A7